MELPPLKLIQQQSCCIAVRMDGLTLYYSINKRNLYEIIEGKGESADN